MTAITRARLRRAVRRDTIGVDVRAAFGVVGLLIGYLSLTLAFPVVIALLHRESVVPFVATAAVGAAFGFGLFYAARSDKQSVGTREAFLIVSMTWLFAGGLGALPYLFADELVVGSPVNALFEGMSGFTTTGASVIVDPSELSRSLLMWRQFTQFLGGMGIIVLALAVLPRLRIGGRQLLQSELAGPTEIERFTDTIRGTAQQLWRVYVGLTIVAFAILAFVGLSGIDPTMTVFDAVSHALSVAALGGFSNQGESVGAFAPVTQYLMLAFMIIAGVNFLRLYRLIFRGDAGVLARDEEMRLYAAFVIAGSALLIIEILVGGAFSGEAAFRHGAFQAVAIMTTAGFATADYTMWGPLAIMTLLLLMFVGASAGSTGGSMKVIRHLLLFKIVKRELEQTIHREVVVPVRASRRVIDDRALRSTIVFVLLYLMTFALGALALVIDARRVGAELVVFEAIGAAAACIGNVGPAFGFAGPFGSYEPFSDFSTGILTGLMWLGRIEIVPFAVLLSRSYWRR